MGTLYWIEVLGSISILTTVLALAGAVIWFLMMVGMVSLDCSIDDEKKWSKRIGIGAILFTLIAVFTPSKESLYMIYGVGGTIDYIKENPTAKQLPDKLIIALDKWVDSQTENGNKDKDK